MTRPSPRPAPWRRRAAPAAGASVRGEEGVPEQLLRPRPQRRVPLRARKAASARANPTGTGRPTPRARACRSPAWPRGAGRGLACMHLSMASRHSRERWAGMSGSEVPEAISVMALRPGPPPSSRPPSPHTAPPPRRAWQCPQPPARARGHVARARGPSQRRRAAGSRPRGGGGALGWKGGAWGGGGVAGLTRTCW